MKKRYLLFACLLITQFIRAQAPGGVSSGLAAWYKGDDGLTATTWADKSGNNNNLTRTEAPAITRLVNFNPTASFGDPTVATSGTPARILNSNHTFTTTATKSANWPVGANVSNYYLVVFDGLGPSNTANFSAIGMGVGYNNAANGDGAFNVGRNSGNGIVTSGDPRLANGNPDTRRAVYDLTPSGGSTLVQWNTGGGFLNGGYQMIRAGFNGTANQIGTTYSSSIGAANTYSLKSGATFTPTYTATTPFKIGGNGENLNTTTGTITSDSHSWPGDISEVLVYKGVQDATTVNKIQSYLAFKYAIGKPGTYIASDGSTFFSNVAPYNFNVAGIGRDDSSGLHQRQARSSNAAANDPYTVVAAGDHPIIGNNNTIGATNSAGAGDIVNNLSYMVWGANNISTNYTNLVYFPVNPVNVRFGTIWKIEERGTIGSVKIAFPKSGFKGLNQRLLVRNNASFDGTEASYPMSLETIAGVEYYTTTHDFNNGDYFTFACFFTAPGGIVQNLAAWYKADSSSVTATQWTDDSGNGKHMLAAGLGAGHEANMPVLESTPGPANNFQPRVAFLSDQDSNRKWTSTYAGNNIIGDPESGQPTLNATIFNISSFPSTTVFDTPQVYSFGTDNPGLNFVTDRNAQKDVQVLFTRNNLGAAYPDWNYAVPGKSQVAPIFTSHALNTSNASGSNAFTFDGGYYSATNAINGTIAKPYIFGSESTTGTGESHSGYTSENIVYEKAFGTGVAADRVKINTYLAVKYGITLKLDYAAPGTAGGNTALTGNGNYIASNGVTVWNATTHATYHNNVAAIGFDPLSDLQQKQSNSVNTGDQVIFAKGTVAISNAANSNDFTNAQAYQFLFWGDNNTAGTNAIPGAPSFFNKLAKTWKVVPVGGYQHNTQLLIPTSILQSLPSKSMLVNTDPTFPKATNTASTLSATTTVAGKEYYVVNFTASQMASTFYFTFSGFKFNTAAGPGGVAANYWLRADKDVVYNGTGNVTNWFDQVLLKEVKQVGTGLLPVYGTDSLQFNFNRYVNFDDAGQALGNLDTSLFNSTATTMTSFMAMQGLGTGGYTNRFFGIDFDMPSTTSGNYRFDWQALHNGKYSSRGSASNSGTYFNASSPNLLNDITSILQTTVTPTTFESRLNGGSIAQSVTGQTNTIGKGGYIYGSNRVIPSPGNGDDFGAKVRFAEHALFERTLTATERRQIESYMSIKYGTPIGDLSTDASYRDASGNVTFTADATYKYDIFGIAKENAAGIDRRISKPISLDAMLTVSTDANFTDMNDTHADILTDAQYLIFAKNNPAGISGIFGSTLTTADGHTINKVLNDRWKVQDKGGVGCVNLHLEIEDATAFGESFYLIVADDPNFTQNVIYKELGTTFATFTDAKVNFADNTNGSSTTGNYFTFAMAQTGLGSTIITPTDVNTIVSGINTIPSATNWKPTVPNTYLEINSNAKGMTVTRVANTGAIADPVKGMIIYDLSAAPANALKVYNGSAWRSIGASTGSSAPSGSSVTFCN